MQIGEPLRTIIVEPLELPVSEPSFEPKPSLSLWNLNLSKYQPRYERARLHFADRCLSRLAVGLCSLLDVYTAAQVFERGMVVSRASAFGEMWRVRCETLPDRS